MKVQFKGKMTCIERHSTDAVVVKFAQTLTITIETTPEEP